MSEAFWSSDTPSKDELKHDSTLEHDRGEQLTPVDHAFYAERITHVESLISQTDAKLARMEPWIQTLMEERHALAAEQEKYQLPVTLLNPALPIRDQLYPEPTYNNRYVHADGQAKGGDLDARRGKDFHAGETYEEGPYATAIMHAGIDLGYVQSHAGGIASDALDRQIGMLDSELPRIGEVEAVVVAGAAGIANVMRIRDALRNVASGRVQTNTIFLAGCERKVQDAERGRLAAKGFSGGATEFESMVIALNELAGTSVDPAEAEPLTVDLPSGSYDGKILHIQIELASKPVDVIAISAPFDPERRESNGNKPVRANTDETFVAVQQLLADGAGKIVIESHDAWVPSQEAVANQVFGIGGKTVIAAGPRKSDRLVQLIGPDGTGHVKLNQPEGVSDEIAKTYDFLTQLRLRASNEISRLGREERALQLAYELGLTPEMIRESLTQPIPNMDALREKKRTEGYGAIPINEHDSRFNEPLTRIKDLFIAGQNYYSRDNATSGEPIPGVEQDPQLRSSIAETFAAINELLPHPAITEHFGGEVELYVEDGVRTIATQTRLFETEVPALIRKNDPDITDEVLDERRAEIIAKPSLDPSKPSPHSTGAAADVILRYKHLETPLFVDGSNVWIGHKDGDTKATINPDHYETTPLLTSKDELAQKNRRGFYAIMSGAAFGLETGFAVNPTEIWHWSRGDQLWALASGHSNAYYGGVTGESAPSESGEAAVSTPSDAPYGQN